MPGHPFRTPFRVHLLSRDWVLVVALVLVSSAAALMAGPYSDRSFGPINGGSSSGTELTWALIGDPPSPPQNLVAEAGDLEVTLNWEPPADEGGTPVVGYNIYRGESQGSESFLITVALVTTYIDLLVENGVTYWYYVTAINLDGESDPSNEVSATPGGEPPTVPGPPRDLVATPGDGSVALTWSVPEDDGGRPITSYHIYRGTSPGGESLYATVGGDILSYTDVEVTNGETYWYQVSAENEVGEGPRSNEVSATPEAPPAPPGPPLDLRATGGDGVVTLEWSPPTDDGGSPVTGYKVYRGTTSGQLSELTTLPDVLSFDDTGVTNGVTYYYEVSALTSAGEGPPSNEASATPMPGDTVPDPPSDLVAVAGDAQVSLSWQEPFDGGSPLTAYNIYRGTTPDGETWLATILPDTPLFTDATVTNDVTYYYYVKAENEVGESGPSNEVSATPIPGPTVPGVVGNLTATGGDQRVTLTWSPADDGGSPITNYKVYRGTHSGDRSDVTTIGDVTTHTDSQLDNGQRYYYVVSAVNAEGEGPPSGEVSATPATFPGAPRNVQGTPGNEVVTIQWSGPLFDGGAAVESYKIYSGTLSGSLTHLDTVGPTDTYEHRGLRNGETHYYQVSAVNRVGEGPRSDEVAATPTSGLTVPSAPRYPVAVAGDRQVHLSWSPPERDGGSPITNYSVSRGTNASDLKHLARTGTATTLLDATGVTNGVTYYYAITALNDQGEGPRSGIVSATPRPDPQGPDTARPKISFVFPQEGANVPAGRLQVSGTAKDDTSVARVRVSADGTTWSDAEGTNPWRADVVLAQGTRTIYAVAMDLANNTASANLTVIVGPGGDQPGPAGTPLEVPGPLIIIASAVASFALTAVTAWLFLNRRRRY